MSSESSDASIDRCPEPNDTIHPFMFEPEPSVTVTEMEADDVFNPEPRRVPPASMWCSCGKCQDKPTEDECVCCHDHAIGDKIAGMEDVRCITDHPGVEELLAEAPLQLAWNSYLAYHRDSAPQADGNARKRLCAYRNLVFWCWTDLRRKERRPLPACLVSMVRAIFPPTDDEELFADWQFRGFMYAEDSD